MLDLKQTLAELSELPRRPSEDTAWIVLTGAPSTGKSTVLERLRLKGYSTCQEQARQLLEQEIARGKSLNELTSDPAMLVKRIFERNLATHGAAPRSQVTVFDRGLPDVLAFGLIDHVDLEPYVRECGAFRFVTAFVFEQVPAQSDQLVYHSQSQLREIEGACEGIYRALGANVQRLPAFSDDRAVSLARRMAIIEEEIRTLLQRTR
ncbi:MAG: ATP-binding protein [Gammaproteobacteria bacterium]